MVNSADIKQQVREKLALRAQEDADFRQQLQEDPRAAIESETSQSLPPQLQIRVIEEGVNEICVIMPPTREALSDEELDAVSGAGLLDILNW